VETKPFRFPGVQGDALAAKLDLPDTEQRACALFAHCFTCGKDLPAIARISRALTDRGIGVLRFDFTGLGQSEGDFAATNFSTNIGDLLAAADALRRRDGGSGPALLVGHSLGGTAVLAAARRIPECRAVATIAAPSEPAHLHGLLQGAAAKEIEARGEAEVSIGGRPFRIRKQFLDDVARRSLLERLDELDRALLILHSPDDEIVTMENAHELFAAARHPKSLVALTGADHLLRRPEHAAYAAALIATWAEPYL
jgi:putative redox protein